VRNDRIERARLRLRELEVATVESSCTKPARRRLVPATCL
jgi:hypothetical protein